MDQFYSAGDIFAFPGFRESLGMVYLEAQSCGLPVVACRNGGIPEVVDEGETGYLIPAGDAVALAERIILHFARPAVVRRRMHRQCKQAVEEKLSFEKHIRGTLDVYQEVLDR